MELLNLKQKSNFLGGGGGGREYNSCVKKKICYLNFECRKKYRKIYRKKYFSIVHCCNIMKQFYEISFFLYIYGHSNIYLLFQHNKSYSTNELKSVYNYEKNI